MSNLPVNPVRRNPVWLILAGGAALAGWLALGYGLIGSLGIGSGLFPFLLSAVIAILSLWSFAFPRPESTEAFALRPFVAVVLAVVMFILLIERWGMVPTVVVTMVTAFLGQVQNDYLPFLIYAALFALAAGLVFSTGLNMPIPLFGAT